MRPALGGPSVRKVLLYSHDTYGLGHLRRNLAIAARLLAAHPGRHVVLVSGSSVSDYFTLPAGLTLVKLPPVVKVGAEQYRPTDPRLSAGLVRRVRSAVIADVARRFRPDVFLVDHSPAGMNGELLPVFDELARHTPGTRVALGLRDILDEPSTVRASWTEQGIYDLLEDVYDELYVYGSQDVHDLGAAYGLDERIQERLQYCGYLDKPPSAPAAGLPVPQMSGPYLLATAGGGGDGTQVLDAALRAAAALGLASMIVTGPLMGETDRRWIEQRSQGVPGATVLPFHPHLRAAMAQASVVVTMGGYNSLCEAVAAGARTVVIPRVAPRREQAIRAELFAQRGLLDVVLPGPDLAQRLTNAVAAGAATPPALSRELDLTGLDRLTQALGNHPRSEDQHSSSVATLRRPA
jgi:predicted glycosyltransferase